MQASPRARPRKTKPKSPYKREEEELPKEAEGSFGAVDSPSRAAAAALGEIGGALAACREATGVVLAFYLSAPFFAL